MLLRFNGFKLGLDVELIAIVVMLEMALKVATSVLRAGLAGGVVPGKVGPLQSALSSQFPVVGAAIQFPDAARAGLDARTAARAADAADAITRLRRFRP